MLFMALFSIVVLTIIRFHLSKENKKFKKEYMALLINSNKMIEMMIPINEQRQKSIDQYTTQIQTETFHPCFETNQDFYESILSMNDIHHFPVRETIFQLCPKSIPQMVTNLNEENHSDEQEIKFI
ncbi:unnamed protein product [Rotaria sordida]|uniref:Uncharacterized protein n=1 Tax=Rotaria sordida TaxID=392033 RepID=A0A813MVE2_9BILA|nr:unnamed protein product [Rotaria sordida]CAF0731134.1 unnamed protein product [Rotaria sordida]CAF0755572.1 unnamed protein product [Rotaria sordida]CAF3528175.1 unnamed protein product [Rotaria sordida]